MKKLLLLFVAISAVLLSGCSKDEPEVKDEPTIVGKWRHQVTDGFVYTTVYEFKKDGTGVIEYHRTGDNEQEPITEVYNFTYSIDGKKLTMSVYYEEDGETDTEVSTIISITKDTLVLEVEHNNDGVIEKERATLTRIK